ncbi:MAG: hypothetical protein NTU74_07590 [Deltaproteobacteria bacterium]|nr:hypothetical protein [Deltaproteobacteria bacterium]
MKKIRIALLLAALGFSGLIIYQNMGYLSTSANLQMNLWIAGSFSVGIINAQLILGAFFAGLLISYFYGLSFRFKNNKIIKSLNGTLNSQMETITALKSELSKYQGPTLQQDPPQSEVPVENT